MLNQLKLFYIVFLLLFSFPAFAYIDPGSGGMIVQGILALVASVIFYLRNPLELLKFIRNFFKSKHDNDDYS